MTFGHGWDRLNESERGKEDGWGISAQNTSL